MLPSVGEPATPAEKLSVSVRPSPSASGEPESSVLIDSMRGSAASGGVPGINTTNSSPP